MYHDAWYLRRSYPCGAAFCFHLDMEYDGLRFVPLAPRLETGAVLAWKKNQIFSSAATRFIETLKHSI